MDLRTRPAEADDVAAIRRLSERAWYAGHGEFVDDAAIEAFLEEYYDAESFLEQVEDAASVFPVAEVAQTVAGYALAHPVDESASTFALVRIYVDPDWWGRGVGSRLLEDVEGEVRARGGDRIKLGVIAENDRAVGFYEARGYERVDGGYDDRLDVDNYTYAKDLKG